MLSGPVVSAQEVLLAKVQPETATSTSPTEEAPSEDPEPEVSSAILPEALEANSPAAEPAPAGSEVAESPAVEAEAGPAQLEEVKEPETTQVGAGDKVAEGSQSVAGDKVLDKAAETKAEETAQPVAEDKVADKATVTKAEETTQPSDKETSPETEKTEAGSGDSQAEQPVVLPTPRTAATTYKVTYTDVATGQVVYQTSRSVNQQTTQDKDEPVSFQVVVHSEVGTAPALAKYVLADNQASAMAAVVVERGGRNNLVNFNVRLDDKVTGSAAPEETEGYSGFRAATYTREEKLAMTNQILWIDFGDASAVTNIKGWARRNQTGIPLSPTKQHKDDFPALQVGTVYDKELFPGYRVRAEVIGLKPFNATDIFKERVEKDLGITITGDSHAASGYNANLNNHWRAGTSHQTTVAEVIVAPQDTVWSNLQAAGVNTGTNLTTFTAQAGGGNIGIQLKVTTFVGGREVPSTMIIADSESAGHREFITMTTNGSEFDVFTVVNEPGVTDSWKPLVLNNGGDANLVTVDSAAFARGGISANQLKYMLQPADVTNAGVGTQVVGPYVSTKRRGADRGTTAPLFITQGATEVGMYINTGGNQAMQIGFLIADTGDAPDSYGQAIHLINRGSGTTAIAQPYLGSVRPDFDYINPSVLPNDITGTQTVAVAPGVLAHAFTADDEVVTETGLDGDEGEEQLLGRGKRYPELNVTNPNYVLNVLANSDGTQPAHISGWLDLNGNGQFEENERTKGTVTGSGTVSLNFGIGGLWESIDPGIHRVAARVRIAMSENEVAEPTGTAISGEVEDFLLTVVVPPRGEKETTTGPQGVNQSAKVDFTAYGADRSDANRHNTMDESIAIRIVTPDGRLVRTYTEPGQGSYVVADDGTVTFTPLPSFVGTARGVVLRGTDKNGLTSSWTAQTVPNINDSVNGQRTMDGVYIPTVERVTPTATGTTSTGLQGKTQTGQITFTPGHAEVPIDTSKPATFANGQTSLTVAGQGTYTVSRDGLVTFVPETSYVGTATTVTVQRPDINGTMASATYTPIVTRVTPTATGTTSTDLQGKTQTGQITFTPGHAEVPIDTSKPATFANGQTTMVVTGQGTYTVSRDGLVTFVPETSYVGTATTVTVQRPDINGTMASATYTPTVTRVTPTATGTTSTGLQGKTQTGQITFTPGHAEVPIDVSKPATFDNGQTTLTVANQGTYTVSRDGLVTFVPLPTFTGQGTTVTVQRPDINGTVAKASYTPTVRAVTPTASPATSLDFQGVTQTGQVTFTPGHADVPIDNTRPATFDNGQTSLTVAGQGTYTVAPNGTVTFVPRPEFTGTATPVRVQRPDVNGTMASATYTPTVVAETPDASPVVSNDLQGATQKSQPRFDTAANGAVSRTVTGYALKGATGNGQSLTVAGQGTYTLARTGEVTFVPDPAYKGPVTPAVVEATIAVQVNHNGQILTLTDKAEGTYTPTVNPVTGRQTPADTSDLQGATQIGRPTFNLTNNTDKDNLATTTRRLGNYKLFLLDDADQPLTTPGTYTISGQEVTLTAAGTVEIKGQGTYSIRENDGEVTFVPDPAFTGRPLPAQIGGTLTVTNQNRQSSDQANFITSSYQPFVRPVSGTATTVRDRDVQGATQTGQPIFTLTANVDKDNIDITAREVVSYALKGTDAQGNPLAVERLVLPGQGVYSVDEHTGEVSFIPEPGFFGTPRPATVLGKIQVTNQNAEPAILERVDQMVEGVFAPEVLPLETASTPDRTDDLPGATQTGRLTFTLTTVNDEDSDPTTKREITGYAIKDANDGPNRRVIAGVGVYSVDNQGVVTFVPDPAFTGSAPMVTVQAIVTVTSATPEGLTPEEEARFGAKALDNRIEATYQATVNPLITAKEPKTSEDIQGATQKGTPTFAITENTDKDQLERTKREISSYALKGADASGKVVLIGVGTYTIDTKTGEVTFVPDPTFVGTATSAVVEATITVTNQDGTSKALPQKIEATYTPTVTAVKPASESKTSEDIQGATQKGQPDFRLNENTDKDQLDRTKREISSYALKGANADGKVVLENVGTYSIDTKTGQVTFVPDPAYVGTPTPATVEATITVTNGDNVSKPLAQKIEATYTPTVTAVQPSSQSKTSEDIQGATQTGTPTFALNGNTDKDNLDVTSREITGYAIKDATHGTTLRLIEGVGAYSVDAETGEVTFIPEPTFTGPAPAVTVEATITVTNQDGVAKELDQKIEATYTPSVLAVEGTFRLATSKDLQGATQTGTPTVTLTSNADKDSNDTTQREITRYALKDATHGTTRRLIAGVGAYTLDEATGQVTFIPEPAFTGEAPAVTVEAIVTVTSEIPEGLSEEEAKRFEPKELAKRIAATYTPTVTAVEGTFRLATSRDLQGATQTGKPIFTLTSNDDNDNKAVTKREITAYALKDATDGTNRLVVAGVGTYRVDETGQVTFIPEPSFTGQAPEVTVQALVTVTSEMPADLTEEERKRFDPVTLAERIETTYQPYVDVVTWDSKDASSSDFPGATQTGRPTITLTNNEDKDGKANTTRAIDSYAIAGATGNSLTTAEGTYTINPDTGLVTFVPAPGFVGQGAGVTVEASVRVTNENNESEILAEKITATYKPLVKAMATTSAPANSSDKQGATQTGKPAITITTGLEDADNKDASKRELVYTLQGADETGKVVVENEGTYTIATDGTVTFIPEPDFVGRGQGVTVLGTIKVTNEKGETALLPDLAIAKYTPSVEEVTNTKTNATSEDFPGATQTGQPTFTLTNNEDKDEKPGTTREIAGYTIAGAPGDGRTLTTAEGTYTIATDGTVTFIPAPGFVGQGAGVTVEASVRVTNENGDSEILEKKVEATYVPNVKRMATSTAPATSTDKQGATQTGKPAITITTGLEDADKKDASKRELVYTLQGATGDGTRLTVENEGTYTIAPDGTVTFIPEPDFVGTGRGVIVLGTIKVTNEKGETALLPDPATAKYTPSVEEVTSTKENATSEDFPGATQTGKPTFELTNNEDKDGKAETKREIAGYSIPNAVDNVLTTAEGTYTIDPQTGVVTFVPAPGFVGQGAGVTVEAAVKVTNEDGKSAVLTEKITATYKPLVKAMATTVLPATSTDKQGATQTGKPAITITTGLEDEDTKPNTTRELVFTLQGADETGKVVVPNEGTYTIAPDGTVTFIPEPDFVGRGQGVTVLGTIKVTNEKGQTALLPDPATAKYTPSVEEVTNTKTNATSEDFPGATQTGQPTFTLTNNEDKDGKAETTRALDSYAIAGATGNSLTVAGEGTYTINPATGEVTFVPAPGFVGQGSGVTVEASVRVTNENGASEILDQKISATYKPLVKAMATRVLPATSTDKQGATQSGKPAISITTGLEDADNKDASKRELVFALQGATGDGTRLTVENEGTYTIATDGTVTFIPEPDFVGTGRGVTVLGTIKVTNENGETALLPNPATAAYTPTVEAVTNTKINATSEDFPGATQTGQPTFTLTNNEDKDEKPNTTRAIDNYAIAGATGNSLTVGGEGTYTIDPQTGVVTFVPAPGFVGQGAGVTVEASVRVTNENGDSEILEQKVSATYKPLVKTMATSTAPATSTDKQGATQTGKPAITITTGLEDADNKDASKRELVYTLQGATGDGTRLTVENEGTYTIATDGTVTFIPEPDFVGTGRGVTVLGTIKVTNEKGETALLPDPATAKYTPSVEEVTNTKTNATSEDFPGATQTGQPTFTLTNNEDKDGKDNTTRAIDSYAIAGATGNSLTVDGEGTYTIAPATGVVTFVPAPGFVGQGAGVTVEASVRVTNENGDSEILEQKISATYKPLVKAMATTVLPATSTDKQGATQTGKPAITITTGLEDADTKPNTTRELVFTLQGATGDGTRLTVENEGTYTIAADGTVTFIPEPDFVGTGRGVIVLGTIKVTNENGETALLPNPATAAYTPTVEAVTNAKTNATSEDFPGATQTGKPTFTLTNNEDKDGKAETKREIAGYSIPNAVDNVLTTTEGIYTINPDTGVVTFVPAPGFVGQGQGVTVEAAVKVTNENGDSEILEQKISATYKPLVKAMATSTAPATSTDKQGATQTGKPTITITTGLEDADNKDASKRELVYSLQGADSTGKVVVPNEGTYTIAQDGTVTFIPEPDFVGTGQGVTVLGTIKVTNEKGETALLSDPATAKYTPSVEEVTNTKTNATSEDFPGATQTGRPTFTLTNNEDKDEKPNTTRALDNYAIAGATGNVLTTTEGTYTINPDTGVVTFVPAPGFVGQAAGVTVEAAVRVTNESGDSEILEKKIEATYVPNVKRMATSTAPASSTDKQGATQTGKPAITITTGLEDADKKDASKRELVFTLQGADDTGEVVVPNEGTYTIAPDGTVTFIPEPDFVGRGQSVTVLGTIKVTNEKGQTALLPNPATATYTPTVEAVTNTKTNATSEDFPGATQTGRPTFELTNNEDKDGKANTTRAIDSYAIAGATGNSLTVAGEGTYTINPATGEVTFVPAPGFVGQGSGVTVEASVRVTNENGDSEILEQKISATYKPLVKAMTTSTAPATSTDKQGATQTGKPAITITTGLEDADTKPNTTRELVFTLQGATGDGTRLTVENEGTYTIATDGTVTFIPEPDFVGTGRGVTVLGTIKVTNESGDTALLPNPATAAYTPTVEAVTNTKTNATSEDFPGATQTGKPTFELTNNEDKDEKPNTTRAIDSYAIAGATGNSLTVDGEGTYTIDPQTGVVTFVPAPGFVGQGAGVTVEASVRVTNENNESEILAEKITATYKPLVKAMATTVLPATSTDKQGATQTGKPAITITTGLEDADNKDASKRELVYTLQGADETGKVVVPNEGTYTIAPDGTVTFIPEPDFVGRGRGVTVLGTIKVTNEKGETALLPNPATAAYTPTVEAVTNTKTNATSEDFPGATQTGQPTFTLTNNEDKDGKAETKREIAGYSIPKAVDNVLTTAEGTYTINPDTGVVTFVPASGFVGQGAGVTVEASVRVTNENNESEILTEKITATYKPLVKAMTTSTAPANSTDKQGATQTGKPAITITTGLEDEDTKPNTTRELVYTLQGATGDGTRLTVENEGTYTIATDGTVTFIPEPDFVGTGRGVTVLGTIKVTNENGETALLPNPATAVYTPTVEAVTNTKENATSEDFPGATQTGQPTFTLTNNEDKDGKAETKREIAGYSIPNAVDNVLTTAEGTYTIAPQTGVVTFIPAPGFVGQAAGVTVEAAVKVTNENGDSDILEQKISATYKPLVKAMATRVLPATSTDKQGATQTGKPAITITTGLEDADNKASSKRELVFTLQGADSTGKVVVPNEGTYTIAPDGTVTFIPEPDFVGTGQGVTVLGTIKVTNENGATALLPNPATAKYTPSVEEVTNTKENATSEDFPGATQTGRPTFELTNNEDKDGKANTTRALDSYAIAGATGNSLTVAGEGTYTINPATGEVTFVPAPGFVGQGAGVTVEASVRVTNENGDSEILEQKISATYKPLVKAMATTVLPATSTDKQGATQTGKPAITITTGLEDADTKPNTTRELVFTLQGADETGKVVVPNEGTYTIATDGTVTFIPEPDFVGTGRGVTVLGTIKVTNEKGETALLPNPATAAYTPTVEAVTNTKTNATSEDFPGATQTGQPTFTLTNNEDKDGKANTTRALDSYAIAGATGNSLTVDGEGTYTIDPATGVVTFIPAPGFVGQGAGVTVEASVRVTNENGDSEILEKKIEATYVPNVKRMATSTAPASSTDKQGATQTGKPSITITTGLEDEDTKPNTTRELVFTLQGADETGKVVVPNEGTYTIAPDGTVTFVPEPDFVGTGRGVTVLGTIKVTNENGDTALLPNPATVAYTPTVEAVTNTKTNATSEDFPGATQTGKPTFELTNNEDQDGKANTTREIAGYAIAGATGNVLTTTEGTYTIDPQTGVVTFVPAPGFVGQAAGVTVEASVRVTNENNESEILAEKITATYKPLVKAMATTSAPANSSDKQGATQTGKPAITITTGLEDEDTKPNTTRELVFTLQGADETGKVVVENEGTYAIAADGTVTFIPEPDFVGTGRGVTVLGTIKVINENGETALLPNPATAAYTPTVEAVTNTKTNAISEDFPGATQTGQPTFTLTNNEDKDEKPNTTREIAGYAIAGATGTSLTVDGEGTYTINPATGVVTFVPAPGFVGQGQGVTVEASVRVTNENGDSEILEQKISATYKPLVKAMATTSAPANSTDKQGATQTGKPAITITTGLEDADTKDASKRELVFTLQGATGDGTRLTVENEGTYTIATDGTVTFIPEPDFVGTGRGVTVLGTIKVTNENGQEALLPNPVTATYMPRVEAVTGQGTPVRSTGLQGARQTGTPVFELTNADDQDGLAMTDRQLTSFALQGADQDGKLVIAGQGLYTIDPATGQVTFVPEPSFTGTATPAVVEATITVTNQDGTSKDLAQKVEATYTPRVVPVIPTGTPALTRGLQGQPQSSKLVFVPGDDSVPMDDSVPATFVDGNTDLTITGEGRYTVTPDGTVTFIPEPGFTGRTQGVEVVRVDANGTPATATYIQVVTSVTPTGTPTTSTGLQGQPQSGQVTFIPGADAVPMDDSVPATFADGSTDLTIPGEGRYTVAPDGTVTFTPEATFTGRGSGVTVVRQDINGTPAAATYTPTVTPLTTSYVLENGRALSATVDGLLDPATFTGYYFKETRVDGDGNLTHVYARQQTSFVDETGQPIQPPQDGTTPDIPIDGYELVSSTTDANGNVTNVYRKVITTSFVDENGNPLKPVERGDQSSTTIPGYELVSITKDDKGNVTNTYRKVVPQPTTSFVDENGNIISSVEEGSVPAKSIPGYELVTSSTDANGNVTYTYRKVTPQPTTSFVDENGNIISSVEEGSVPAKSIPGYELVTSSTDANGNVTYTYRKVVPQPTTSFVDENGNVISSVEEGSVPAKSIPGYELVTTTTDANGNVTYTYRKVIHTHFVDDEGNILKPDVEGFQPGDKIEGYYIINTVTDADGNVTYIYRQVRTRFVDEAGNELSPELRGAAASGRIPGYYAKETRIDENGNVTHIYAKLTTSFVDESGQVLLVIEEGTNPSKAIPGYVLVATTSDQHGNITHVYRQQKPEEPTPTPPAYTFFTTEDGFTISRIEEGNQAPKVIDGYILIGTRVDDNGNTIHIYRKLPTPTPVVEGQEPHCPLPVVQEAPMVIIADAQATPIYLEEGARELPKTGDEGSAATLAGSALLATALGLIGLRRRRKED